MVGSCTKHWPHSAYKPLGSWVIQLEAACLVGSQDSWAKGERWIEWSTVKILGSLCSIGPVSSGGKFCGPQKLALWLNGVVHGQRPEAEAFARADVSKGVCMEV